MDKLLTTEQAVAIRDAMCALNNVGGIIDAHVSNKGVLLRVQEDIMSDDVFVKLGDGTIAECYENQRAFFVAYGVGD